MGDDMDEKLFYLRGWLFMRRQWNVVFALVALGFLSHYGSGSPVQKIVEAMLLGGIAWYATLAFMLNEGRVSWAAEFARGGWRIHLVRLLKLSGYLAGFQLVILAFGVVLFTVLRGGWGSAAAIWSAMGAHLVLTFAATIIWGPVLPQVVDGQKGGLRAARRCSRGFRFDIFMLMLRGPLAIGVALLVPIIFLGVAARNGSGAAGALTSIVSSLGMAYVTAMTAAILTEVYRRGGVAAIPAAPGGAQGPNENKILDYPVKPGNEDGQHKESPCPPTPSP